MKDNCTDSKKSIQEEPINKEPNQEKSRENPCEQGVESEKKQDHKKIERCEPCLHCGSHCIYLNRE